MRFHMGCCCFVMPWRSWGQDVIKILMQSWISRRFEHMERDSSSLGLSPGHKKKCPYSWPKHQRSFATADSEPFNLKNSWVGHQNWVISILRYFYFLTFSREACLVGFRKILLLHVREKRKRRMTSFILELGAVVGTFSFLTAQSAFGGSVV